MEDEKIPKKSLKVQFHNSRPRGKPNNKMGGYHQRNTSQILGTQGWKRQAEDRIELSAKGGQCPVGAVAPRWNGMECTNCENK
jgi:hypothetical protein